jgi:Heavy-metal-associated domain
MFRGLMEYGGAARESAWGWLAGLIGSLCCIGPSAAILLGLGSSSALFGLHVDRTIALGGGVAMLAGGAALILRRARTCSARPARTRRQIALMLGAGAVAYTLLGVAAPWAAERYEQASAAPSTKSIAAMPAASAPLRQATLTVEKMDCPPCVTRLRSLLGRKPFISQYAVNDGNEQVTIVYDSSQIDAAALRALMPAQFKAKLDADQALP